MLFKKKALISIVISSLLVTGCLGNGPKEAGGTLIGGATGALIGSQFGKGDGQLVGVAIGTLLGAALGGHIGREMDARDRELAERTARYCLENRADHQYSTWHNPNNNHSGRFAVTRTVEMPESHLVCRDYVHEVIIDGRREKVHGRACRDVRDSRAHWTIEN